MASFDSISISPSADPLSTSSADNHAHPHSLQSPLTPAAVSESNNGGPSMRWKSYTATKHREISATECTNDRSTAAPPPNLIPPDIMNSKGKLVINLCGIPRSVMKQSPVSAAASSSSSLKMKGTLEDKDVLDIMKMKVCEASSSSTEGIKFPHTLGEDTQNDLKLLNEVQCPASEQEVLETIYTSNNVQVSGLTRKMCRRIEKIRRSVMNSEKTSSRSSQTIAAVLMSQSKKKQKKKKHSLQTNTSLKSELNVETNKNILTIGKIQAGEFNGGLEDPLVEVKLDASRSTRDSSLTKDQLAQFDNINGKLTASRSTRDTTLAKDQLEQYNNINVKIDASMYDNHDLDDGMAKGMNDNRELGDGIISKETKEDDLVSKDIMTKSFSKVRRNAKSDGGGFSETSKLDMKEQTVLETLLRDEPAGYSSAGGSERSRSYKSGSKAMKAELSFHGDEDEDDDVESADAESERKGDAEGNHSDEYEDPDTYTSQSREYDGEEDYDGNGLSGSTQRTINGRGAYFSEQVIPSVLCDAEGNMWHIGKRAEQARGARKPRELPASGETKLHGLSNHKQENIEVLKHSDLHILPPTSSSIAPFNHLIETTWKWPSDSDYTINPNGDVSSRSMVSKERSVFVGCIPDGTENLEAVLHNLMGEFLERFDFAPTALGQIRLVKIGKDYAFLELATEKVAHIVLAANQLDVFEWGVNGFHFNIEGCKGTHTSVRPLIEYMPLKPGRIIFVGNIPKSHWKKEYLEVFFTRLLLASDGPAESTFVTSVFLLPESCDAYVELSSELMADSVIFKCTKVPQLLKDIGEDVFICRDPSSVPLMSKHKGGICPQRSLFVGISSPCQGFKIDAVRKIFEEILPVISRETNQPGYLEYISVQPGKDYAFFQFNSEAIVDAVMDEYIDNTQIFTSNSNTLSYIILRPPGYVRPGAKYSCGSNYSGGKSKGMFTHGQFKTVDRKKNMVKQPGSIQLIPRRFGDEPAKKADCVMSIGASPLPLASWNGLSSAGAVATHPDSMVVIEGLPKGLSYKLLRGALNELFERSLRGSGLLEVGLLLLRYLDRDGDLDVVASLPSAKFVRVLLSMRKIFTIAGNEIRLLPKGGAKRVNWKGNPADCLRSQGDLSCLTDDEGNMQREASRYSQRGLSYPIKRKKGHSKGSIYSHLISDRTVRRKGFGLVAKEEQYEEETTRNSNTPQCKKGNKQENKLRLQQRWSGLKGRYKALSSSSRSVPTKVITVSHQQNQGISPRVKMLGVRESSMMSRPQCRSILRVNGSGQKAIEEVPKEILRIVSAGGKRKIQSLDTQPVLGNKGTTPAFGMANKRRRFLQQKPAFTQNRLSIRNRSSFC